MNEDYAALLNELESLCREYMGDDNALEAAACIRAIEIIEAIRNDRHVPAQEPDADPFGDDAELCASLQSLDTDIGYRAASRIGQLAMLAAAKKKEGE